MHKEFAEEIANIEGEIAKLECRQQLRSGVAMLFLVTALTISSVRMAQKERNFKIDWDKFAKPFIVSESDVASTDKR